MQEPDDRKIGKNNPKARPNIAFSTINCPKTT